jgi:hypothetical protein
MHATKKRTALALAGSAALVAGVAAWPAVAAADSGGDGSYHGHVIEGTFATDRLEQTFLDHDGNKVASLGDQIVYTDASTGSLGDATDYASCTFHQVDVATDSAILHCSLTSTGPRGSLTAEGVTLVGLSAPVLREPTSYAVTGGTGEFASASGEIYVKEFTGAGLDFRTSGSFRILLGG